MADGSEQSAPGRRFYPLVHAILYYGAQEMKRFYLTLFAAAGIAALIAASATTAQPPLSQPPLARRDADNVLRLKRGQQYLVHASPDTVIEVFVDQPITAAERLQYIDLDSGKSYLLPNNANVRLQGNVVISREAEGKSVADPQIRWRYVDTIFASYSRDRR